MKDLTNKKFNNLTVVRKSENTKGRTAWYCMCNCGNYCTVQTRFLKSGATKSCGCIAKESARKLATKLHLKKKELLNLDEVVKRERDTRKEKYFTDGIDVSAITQKKRVDNKSGVKGVSWDKTRCKWKVALTIGGKTHNIGRFDTLEDAKKAREIAEEKFFKPVIEKYNSDKKEI